MRLPTEFGVIPSRFLFFRISSIFNGRKIKKNTSRPRKILEKLIKLDWIFANLCAKFQLKIPRNEFFRGGGDSWDLVVSTPARAEITLIAL